MNRRRTSPPLSRDERGMALALALFAIVVIGALVAGTFYAGRLEFSGGRNAVHTTQAQEAADAGLADAFVNWDATWNSLISGTSAPATTTTVGNGVRFTRTVRRLGGNVYFVSSTGERLDQGGNVLASRALGRLAKLFIPNLTVEAAVTSYGDTRVGGNATIDGRNTAPSGWLGCAAAPDKAAVRTNENVVLNGSPQIYGATPMLIENDPAVVPSMFTDPFNALLPLTSITLAPGTYNSMAPTTTGLPARCDKSNPLNWGEPRRGVGSVPLCQTYFPVIHVNGDLHLTGGLGQGILLVSGDLRMQGGFEFVGVVIVLGEVITTANSSKVTGAILANNADLGDETVFGGTPVVAYSKCAIDAVLASTATGIPLAQRSWAQLY